MACSIYASFVYHQTCDVSAYVHCPLSILQFAMVTHLPMLYTSFINIFIPNLFLMYSSMCIRMFPIAMYMFVVLEYILWFILQAFLPSLIQENSGRSSVVVIPPHTYARHALNSVGQSPSSYGHWVHALQMWLLHWFVPDSVWVWWTRSVNINLRSQGMELKLERRSALLNILKHSRDTSFERSSDNARQRSNSALGPPTLQYSPVVERRRSHSFQSGNLIISTK